MRHDGRETWHRLIDWDKGQTPAERLSALVLNHYRCKNIDPSHPLGGPDGLKDVICEYNGVRCIAACYFPRGQMTDTAITNKFTDDYEGVERNNAKGFIFITNQEMTLGLRDDLKVIAATEVLVEIIHLERLASILNRPEMYGVSLEFLEIEMTNEEQLAYYATSNNQIQASTEATKTMIEKLHKHK